METEQKKAKDLMEETEKTATPETEEPAEEEKREEAGEDRQGFESRKEKREKEKKPSHQQQKEIDSLKAQLAEKNDQILRLAAEYDNYRKRTEKEKGECYVSAYGDALKAFLPLLDVLYQAQQYSPEDPGIAALVKQAEDILAKLGIRPMETDGAAFDPVFHNAVMHEENPEYGENVVVQTFQRGYLLGDRVLRPAMVKVAN